MARKLVNTYLVIFHQRGNKADKGQAWVEATTAEFARKRVYRAMPSVVIDKTQFLHTGPVYLEDYKGR